MFNHHGISSLTRCRVCLLLVVLSLSGATMHKVKLILMCTICTGPLVSPGLADQIMLYLPYAIL